MRNKSRLTSLLFTLPLLWMLPGCSGSSNPHNDRTDPSIYSRLTEPGEGKTSPIDAWNPEIAAASRRFHVKPSWIKAVMMQESGGHQYMNGHVIRSVHGAVGLMQLKPSTYRILADRYHLGSDPYTPRNNIMAGTAYIRELDDQFGSPYFLAAYTCGPGCVIAYRKRHVPLPDYARTYMNAVSKHLNDSSLEQTADSYISESDEPTAERILQEAPIRHPKDAIMAEHATAPSLDDSVDDTPDANGDYNFKKSSPKLSTLKEEAIANTQRGAGGIRQEALEGVSASSSTIQIGSFSSLPRARRALQLAAQASPSAYPTMRHQIEKVTFDDGHSVWRVRFLGVPAQQRTRLCPHFKNHGLTCSPVHDE